MIYALITVVLVVLVAYRVAAEMYGDFTDCVLGALLGALISVLVNLLLSVIVLITIPTTPVLDSDVQIKALKDGSSVDGSFFLGTGTVDGEMEYRFMTEEDGGLRMKTVSAESAIVHDTDGAPHVSTYVREYQNGFVRFLFGPGPWMQTAEYRIFVPEGTVKYDYNIDLE